MFIGDGGAVAGGYLLAVEGGVAVEDLEPGESAWGELVVEGGRWIDAADVDGGVLVEGERGIGGVGGGDESKPEGRGVVGEAQLLVGGFQAPARGEDPDLIQMDGVAVGGVEFAVGYACAGGDGLHLAGGDIGGVAHAVSVS